MRPGTAIRVAVLSIAAQILLCSTQDVEDIYEAASYTRRWRPSRLSLITTLHLTPDFPTRLHGWITRRAEND